jgi:hypothetical protein
MSNPAHTHYQKDVECIDVIETLELGSQFCLANILKYAYRIASYKAVGTIPEDSKVPL